MGAGGGTEPFRSVCYVNLPGGAADLRLKVGRAGAHGGFKAIAAECETHVSLCMLIFSEWFDGDREFGRSR
jgi:hypothetical protein